MHSTTINVSKSNTRSTTMVAIVDEYANPAFLLHQKRPGKLSSRAGRSEMVINPMAVITNRGHCGYFTRGSKMMPQR